MKNKFWYKVLCVLLIAIGLLQSIGYVVNNYTLQALGIISTASPLPLVFNKANGVEVFKTKYEVEYLYNDKKEKIILGTKELERIKGPLNRKCIFANTVCYAYSLSPEILNDLMYYSFCKNKIFDSNSQKTPNSINLILKVEENAWVFPCDCTKR